MPIDARRRKARARTRHFSSARAVSASFSSSVDRVPIILVGVGYRLLALAPAVIFGCLCLRFCLGFDRSCSPGYVFRFDRSFFLLRSFFLRRGLLVTFLVVARHYFPRLLIVL